MIHDMTISWINFMKRKTKRKTDPKFLRELSDMYHKERTENFRENIRNMQNRSRQIEEMQTEKQESYHDYIARRLRETKDE